jgi:hypothetical protein
MISTTADVESTVLATEDEWGIMSCVMECYVEGLVQTKETGY